MGLDRKGMELIGNKRTHSLKNMYCTS